MAHGKKGQLYQFLVPMVDATDFASVESAITESDFNSGATRKFYGFNQGVSTATTSGSISKTASLVRSGVFRLTLKTTENNYDGMMVRINKTGCAEQIVTWSNVDNDDSDMMSALTVIQSMASDAASAAAQANSRILLVESRLSDLDSRLVSDLSDVLSQVLLSTSAASDAASAAQQANSRTLVVQSRLSDLDSRLVSDVSDIYSAAVQTNSRVLLNLSRISDVQSFLSDLQSDLISHLDTTGVGLNASTMSDLRSAITGVTATVSASDISDIASAVKATLASDISDILSAAVQTNSRVLLNLSRISDVYSLLSDLHSDVGIVSGIQSDIYSLMTAGAPLGASDLSDLRSAITANGILKAGADPTTVVGVTDNLAAKIDWLTAMSRNKLLATGSVQSLRNDADSADIASRTVSDDGTTYTQGEWAGP